MNYREMDRLIAQNIMGWKNSNVYIGNAAYWLESINGNPNSHKVICQVGEFKPTESIADAWRVVEKFKDVEIQTNINGKHFCRVWVGYRHYESRDKAESTPVAICLAALKSVGINL